MTEKYVKPDRETVARRLYDASGEQVMGHIERGAMVSAQADAVLDLWPGESRATVQAEALRAFADTRGVNVGDEDDEWWRGYRQAQRECLHDASASADRLAAEGGAS